MAYTFICPIDNCGEVMTTDAVTIEDGLTALTPVAKKHVTTIHPDVVKTDTQIRTDVAGGMTQIIEENSAETDD